MSFSAPVQVETFDQGYRESAWLPAFDFLSSTALASSSLNTTMTDCHRPHLSENLDKVLLPSRVLCLFSCIGTSPWFPKVEYEVVRYYEGSTARPVPIHSPRLWRRAARKGCPRGPSLHSSVVVLRVERHAYEPGIVTNCDQISISGICN
jgi:hypothetical protein